MNQHSNLTVLVIVFASLLYGCGTVTSAQVDVKPLPTAGQQLAYKRGVPMMRNTGENTTVIVSPVETPRRQTYRNSFWVWVHNKSSDQSFNFKIENVTVRYNGDRSKVLSYAEAENEAYAAKQNQKILAALAYSSQSLNADQAATSQVNSIGMPSVQIYDPSKAQQIRTQAGNQLQQNTIEAESVYQSEVAALSGYIRRETIAPGEAFGGYFLFDTRSFQGGKANSLTITVTAGSDVHEFNFWEFNLGSNLSDIEPVTPSEGQQSDQEDAPQNIFDGNFFNGRKIWGN